MLGVVCRRERLVSKVLSIRSLRMLHDIDVEIFLILRIVIHSQVHLTALLSQVLLTILLFCDILHLRNINSRNIRSTHILARYPARSSPDLFSFLQRVLPTINYVIDMILGLSQHAHQVIRLFQSRFDL